MTTQNIIYQYMSSYVYIHITDTPQGITKPEYDAKVIGKYYNIPVVNEVSVNNNNYTIMPEKGYTRMRYFCAGMKEWVEELEYRILCPKDGLKDVQIKCEVLDDNGKVIPTTQLPKINFTRGKFIYMSGPLFSGTTADWEVKVEGRLVDMYY